MSSNRISKFASAPDELPRVANEMIERLVASGADQMEARKHVMQALIGTFNSLVFSDVPDQNKDGANEFIVLIGHNTLLDPKIKIAHSCWLKSDRATDNARAYGILCAFAQYWGTRLIAQHVNKDDYQRAFTDFYRNIEAHVQQLREHERQEKLGGGEPDGG
jgi:hypothetical protein